MTSPNPFQTPAPRTKSRALLLGAVAIVALTGAVANSFALAPDAPAQTQSQISAGPASFADVVDRVRGAVVSVKVNIIETAASDDEEGQGRPQFQPGDPMERFFKRFGEEGLPFGRGQKQPQRKGQALGSGFIISSDGYVVTNNHVVEKASEVSLTMEDGKTYAATVVGTDKKTDLALLKIKDGGNFKFVDWSATTPRVGDWVIAVGNPFGLGGTVTAGIVSARGRDIGAGPYDDFLQIDAPVNRGNSGGPTFDGRGQVVGVNTAIFSPSGGSVGIGFAIPAEVAKSVVAELKDKGSVSRGYIGVQIQAVTPEIAESLGLKNQKGALVADAQPDSPAKAAGIRSGDVITAVNGEKIDGPKELSRKIAAAGPEKKVELTYLHDGAEKIVSVKLGTLPNEKQASAATSKPEPASLNSFGLALAPGRDGVVVARIDPEGAAAQKGLKQGDVILEANGAAVSRPSDIKDALSLAKKDGRKAVLLRVKSGAGTRYVALATNPAS